MKFQQVLCRNVLIYIYHCVLSGGRLCSFCQYWATGSGKVLSMFEKRINWFQCQMFLLILLFFSHYSGRGMHTESSWIQSVLNRRKCSVIE